MQRPGSATGARRSTAAPAMQMQRPGSACGLRSAASADDSLGGRLFVPAPLVCALEILHGRQKSVPRRAGQLSQYC